MNKTVVMAGVIALVVIAFSIYFMGNRTSNNQTQSPVVVTEVPTAAPTETIEPSGSAMKGEVKEFTVVSKGLNFTPTEIKVKKGDKVKITYKNTLGTHSWTLDEFNAATKTISAGESETITFTADKAGTFEFYCSVNNHRAMGMKGTLVVE